jgi:outer membrane lipopolysaccharide assembly protein LptE/RlpB
MLCTCAAASVDFFKNAQDALAEAQNTEAIWEHVRKDL